MLLKRLACGLALAVMITGAPVSAAISAGQNTAFRLGVGDKLRITVFEEPDMTGEYAVGNLGRIALPLIGDVEAGGLTVPELEQAIRAALGDGFITNASVSIELIEARPFFILGDVANPGSYPFTEGMTVLRALALAGGNQLTERDEAEALVQLAQAHERRDLLAKDFISAVAREARLLAWRDERERIRFPKALVDARSDPRIGRILAGEARIFATRIGGIESEIAIIERLKAGVGKEVSAYNTQLSANRSQVALLNELLADQNKLLSQNLTRKNQVLELKIQTAQAKVDRGSLLVDLAQAEQRVHELDLRVIELRNAFQTEIADALNASEQELSRLRTSLQAAEETLRQSQRRLGRARSALAGDPLTAVSITRRTADGLVRLAASDDIAVIPGDIVRINDDAELMEPVVIDLAGLVASYTASAAPLPEIEQTAAPETEQPSQDGGAADTARVEPEPEDPAATAVQVQSAAPTVERTPARQAAAQEPRSAALESAALENTSVQVEPPAGQALLLQVQDHLNELGYGQPPGLLLDGLMGPRTTRAIRAFQLKAGMQADGRPSPELLRRLEDARRNSGTDASG